LNIQNGISGETTTFKSIGTIMKQSKVVNNYLTRFLNSLNFLSMPPRPHIFTLQIDVPVVFFWNINLSQLYIGTRKRWWTISLKLQFWIENSREGRCTVTTYFIDPNRYATWIQTLQFPVQLVFAIMTVNKAQGKSLQVCGLDLEITCFLYGQLYVASLFKTHRKIFWFICVCTKRKNK
jgi:hypothetical protein